ncbi:hypothetical protein PF004_g11154 [Phytophthora fragariae]|uniref:HTH psq-type domain-containing protein n=1 Tax=Phytophthora fragariae TaxID=53985 RepID=A0A6G0NYS2_9STRA|nr:hypothetical protein PF004_g11154 [Phytophthora fragariae]
MDESSRPPKKKQRSFTVREKRGAVRRMREIGVEEVAHELRCARGTANGWWQQAETLFSFTGHATSKTMKGQGRKVLFPHVPAVVTYMKDVRRDEKALTTRGIMEFMLQIEPAWVASYMQTRGAGS